MNNIFGNAGHFRAPARFRKGKPNEIENSFSARAAAALLALTQLAAAQGTSGGTGAIASIPGSVVRGHEQGPGLISIITGSTLPNSNWDSRQNATRPRESAVLSKQTGK
jgi:hypothetical protein